MTPLKSREARIIAGASDIYEALISLVKAVGDLPENSRGTVQGIDLNHAYERATRIVEQVENGNVSREYCHLDHDDE